VSGWVRVGEAVIEPGELWETLAVGVGQAGKGGF